MLSIDEAMAFVAPRLPRFSLQLSGFHSSGPLKRFGWQEDKDELVLNARSFGAIRR